MVLETIAAWGFANPAIATLLFLLAYFVLGFMLKYVDAALDDKLFGKKKALFVACIMAVIVAIMMNLSEMTLVIFTAVILGVIIARKVDNFVFVVGTFLCFALYFMFGGVINPLIFNIQVFMLLFLAILLEEKVDYKKEKWFKTKKGKCFSFVFEYGFMLKVAAVIGFLVITYQPIFFAAVILFDLGYDLMLFIVHKKLGKGILWG